MAAVTVRNLSDLTHEALKRRAARHGRSTEAEIRQILEDAIRPSEGMGTTLARIGERLSGSGLKLPRRTTKVSPAEFE
jgi:plasmid stability protein